MLEQELLKLDMHSLKKGNVALMGRLEHVREMMAILKTHGVSVNAVLDNDLNKAGALLEGVPVCVPEDARKYYQTSDGFTRVIIYSPKYWEEMKEQLEELGYIDREEIIVLNRPSLEGNLRMVIDGIQLYRSIQQEFGNGIRVFIADCPLGDYFLLGVFLKEYCKKNGTDDYVMVGTSRGIGKLSPWLGIKNVKKLTLEESMSLIRAWMFLGKEVRITPLTVWQGIFRFNPPVARQMPGFSFTDTFRCMVLGLPSDTMPDLPERGEGREEVIGLFAQSGLSPGRTVLLSPYSYSIPSPSEHFWLKLEEELLKKGYRVAVNIGEEREKNIFSSAVPVKLDFRDIMVFMEMAGTVIGMRSGFFDITAQAVCRRIVLYPGKTREMVHWNSTDRSFCSLGAMGLCNNEIEVEIKDDEKTVMEIVGYLD